MATITADIFQAMLNLTDADISNTNAEYIIDQGINKLNTYGADLANMSGTAGSKTWSGESKEAGAILEAARITYHAYYEGQESVSLAGLSVTSPNMLNNPVADAAIKDLARQLSELDVSVG